MVAKNYERRLRAGLEKPDSDIKTRKPRHPTRSNSMGRSGNSLPKIHPFKHCRIEIYSIYIWLSSPWFRGRLHANALDYNRKKCSDIQDRSALNHRRRPETPFRKGVLNFSILNIGKEHIEAEGPHIL